MIRKKTLKKILLGLLAFWFVLLALIYFSSGKYRDHALRLLKTQLDENLTTTIEVNKDDIKVSLIRNFPNVLITLNDIFIRSAPGPDYSQFSYAVRDTLLYARHVSLVLNLKSLLNENLIINQVIVENASVNILRDSEGTGNYNIWKSSVTTDTAMLQLNLDKIQLEKVKLNYIDKAEQLHVRSFCDLADLSGNFSGDDFTITAHLVTTDNYFQIRKEKYADPGQLIIEGNMEVANKNYSFSDIDLNLNGLKFHGKGAYKYTDGSFNFDFETRSASLEKLNKSVFKNYLNNEDIKAQKGQLSFRASIEGDRKNRTAIRLNFNLSGVSLLDKKAGIRITDSFLSGSYSNGRYRNKTSSTLMIDTLFCRANDSWLSLNGSYINFVSPHIKGSMAGDFELSDLLRFNNFGDTYQGEGSINADIRIDGILPSIKNLHINDLKKVKLSGDLSLKEVQFRSLRRPLPEVLISGKVTLQNLAEIELNNVSLNTKNSQLQLNGTVSNLPFFSTDKSRFPIYRCQIDAKNIYIEDFLLPPQGGGDTAVRLNLPDSLLLYANIKSAYFHFGKFEAKDLSAQLRYQPKNLEITNFRMNSQGGNLYSDMNLSQKSEVIYVQGRSQFSQVDISDLFIAFNEFRQDVITHEHIDGKLSGTADFRAGWDLMLNPLYNEIGLNSSIRIENGELINYQPMLALSDFIEVEELKHIKFDKLNMEISIANQNVSFAQTTINSSAISLSASGNHTFENTYDYRFQVQLADVLWKRARRKKPQNNEFGYVVDDGLGRTTIPLRLVGKDTDFTVTYDKKTARGTIRQHINEEKEEWRQLLNKEEKTEKQDEIKLNWEDIEEEEEDKKQLPENEIDEQGDDTQEFQIEWED